MSQTKTRTKILKGVVDTNKLIANSVDVGNIIAEDVMIDNMSVRQALFSEQTKTNYGPYLTTELFPTGAGASNAIRVRMFEMNPANYIGKNLTTITVYKGTGHEFDSADFASVANNPNGVWLFVDCIRYVQNEQGQTVQQVIDRKFSINRANQTGAANQETTTTWEFIPFELKPEYEVLQFRLTNQQMTPIYPTSTKSSHALLVKSSNRGGDGWKSLDQNKVIDTSATMGKTDSTVKFSFMLQTVSTGFATHMYDEIMHLSQADRQFLTNVNDHILNDDIHITDEQRTNLNELSQGNVLQNISNISEDLSNHKNDSDIHFVNSQKSDILRSVRSYNQFQQEYLQGQNEMIDYSTKEILNQTSNGNAARLHSWDMNAQQYRKHYLSQIIVPYPTNILSDSDPAVHQPLQLFVDCLDENGNIIDTYFSNNNQGQSEDSGEACWQFDEIYIKKSYQKLRFRMTKEWNVAQRPTTTKTHQLVCYTYNANPQWGVIDQDNKPVSATMNFRFKMRKEIFGLGELLNNLVQRIIDLQEKVRRLENS